MHVSPGTPLFPSLPPLLPPAPRCSLPPELEAANQRLIASDRENRLSSRPRAADATTARSSKEMEDAQRVAATLRQQVQHQSQVIDRLKRDVGDRSSRDRDDQETAAGGMHKAVEVAEAAAEAAQDEADELRDRLAETERELQRMERRSAMSAGRGGDVVASDGSSGLQKSSTGLTSGADGVPAGEKEVRLEQENRRLREELQAFDLDFFEEIEDLKYKYSEAARKLRQYE